MFVGKLDHSFYCVSIKNGSRWVARINHHNGFDLLSIFGGFFITLVGFLLVELPTHLFI
jgi:hypothetical protein